MLLEILLYVTMILNQTSDDEDTDYPIVDVISSHGYPVEVHNITTEDGYILNMQRIKHGKFSEYNRNSRPVLLMHGFTTSAFCYVAINDSLPYILADNNYDVWLGNARGSRYSNKHVTLSRTNDTYWDFSMDEIAYFDLPALIKHIIKNTGHEKIHYIGHSQGTTDLFMMSSVRPEMKKHIRLMTAIAPVTFLGHVTNQLLVQVASNIPRVDALMKALDIKGVDVIYQDASQVASLICDTEMMLPVCKFILGSLEYTYEDFMKNSQVNASELLLLGLEGLSLREMYHFTQFINTGLFRKYDFGEQENLQRYGTTIPPSYNLQDVTFPVALYISAFDLFTRPKDIEKMVNLLPNVVYRYDENTPNFNHFDFLIHKNITKLYNDIVRVMDQY